jgi:hypothetical protein
MNMQPLIVNSHALYELIVQPHFNDMMEGFTGYYNGTLSEFTVFNKVSLAKGTPIIDIFTKTNILQRKDASCKTNWKQIAKGSTRKITVDEIYSAVEDCQEEFYQGCLKDFRNQSPMFRNIILDFFKKAVGMDVATNSYFGDISRADTDEFSLNKFDGIFTKYAEYIAGANQYSPVVLGAIPSVITPTDAYNIFDSAFQKRTRVMRHQLKTDLGFYVDENLAEALEKYYASIQEKNGQIGYYVNGVPELKFRGVPVFVEPTWTPVLESLNGGNPAHAMIFTVRQNFIFGTNDTYGGGANLNQGLRVWWSEDDEVWRYKMHLCAGTEIASPHNTVFAITNIV